MAETQEHSDLAAWELRHLVTSGQYPDEQAALRGALRALFQTVPQAKIRMVVSAYEAGEISLGRAAAMLGIAQEEMTDILRNAGVMIHLGPQTLNELHEDVRNA